MPLTDRAAASAKPKEKDYKLSDEKGLHLLVKKNGSKYWRLKYRIFGKEKTLALGVYPEISLKEARGGRDEARKLITQHIDPSAEKQSRKATLHANSVNTFEALGREWFSKKISDKSQTHQDRTWRLLEKDLFPRLGRQVINTIDAPTLLEALRRIEGRGAIETAHRAKNVAGQVFRYAIATGRAERDPSPDLKGALANKKVTHFAAITTPKEAGMLMVAIDTYQGTAVVCAALKLSPLLFCRPGELRHLEWSDINWEEDRVEIPAERMKIKEPHIIPLCRQARAILQDLQLLTGRHRYVFPSARGASRPLSENGVRVALRSMGYDNQTMTAHGFRAMARTLLDEVLGYRIDWIEHQLAHAVKDANGRAYNRTKHLPQRAEMMQRWADYLDELKAQSNNSNIIIAGLRISNG
uniref:tyrosine-type recombinase/integrase n=1 Tax=Marinobacterium profundum TaxID=1714300 RepID=UPI000836AB8B|nr:integrase arm-type DNA-binding domain-containing protein [Marinobacterium profundum]